VFVARHGYVRRNRAMRRRSHTSDDEQRCENVSGRRVIRARSIAIFFLQRVLQATLHADRRVFNVAAAGSGRLSISNSVFRVRRPAPAPGWITGSSISRDA